MSGNSVLWYCPISAGNPMPELSTEDFQFEIERTLWGLDEYEEKTGVKIPKLRKLLKALRRLAQKYPCKNRLITMIVKRLYPTGHALDYLQACDCGTDEVTLILKKEKWI